MGFRLLFLSAALIFFQAGLILLAVGKSESLVAALDTVTKREVPARKLLFQSHVEIEGIKGAVLEAFYAQRAGDRGRFKKAESDLQTYTTGFLGRMESFKALSLGEKVDGLAAAMTDAIGDYVQGAARVTSALEAEMRGARSEVKAPAEYTSLERLHGQLHLRLEEVEAAVNATVQARGDQGRDIVRSLIVFSAIGLGISFLVAFAIYVWTKLSFRRLTNQVGSVTAAVDELSRVLREEASRAREATIQQGAAIQQSASALSEVSSMIMQTGGNAKLSKDTAFGAKAKAAEGEQIMERMTQAMGSISKANTQLQEIAKVIDDITSKTTVINDIVFKTQLLSFNASIEAARAGQHGRGFAVVAEEVGNLAELSGQAANDIEMLLNDSQRRVRETLELIQNRVVDGNRVSGQALQTFNEIAKNIEEINGQVRAISDATQQQEIGVQQTTAAMKEMDASSRTTTASAAQVQNTAEQLRSQSQDLAKVLKALSHLTGTRAFAAPSGAHHGKSSSLMGRWNHRSEEPADDAAVDGLLNEIAAKTPGTAAPVSEKADADDPNFKKVV